MKNARGRVSGAAGTKSHCRVYSSGSGLVGVAAWGGPNSDAALEGSGVGVQPPRSSQVLLEVGGICPQEEGGLDLRVKIRDPHPDGSL